MSSVGTSWGICLVSDDVQVVVNPALPLYMSVLLHSPPSQLASRSNSIFRFIFDEVEQSVVKAAILTSVESGEIIRGCIAESVKRHLAVIARKLRKRRQTTDYQAEIKGGSVSADSSFFCTVHMLLIIFVNRLFHDSKWKHAHLFFSHICYHSD